MSVRIDSDDYCDDCARPHQPGDDMTDRACALCQQSIRSLCVRCWGHGRTLPTEAPGPCPMCKGTGEAR